MKNILMLSVLFLLATTSYAACKLSVEGTATLQFVPKELKTEKSCKKITVTLKNTSTLPAQAMGHNWVLVKTADANAVATDGLVAGLANNYVKPKDSRVLAYTKIIGGGETTSITFNGSILKAGQDYTYICTFPGHSGIMRGKLVVD